MLVPLARTSEGPETGPWCLLGAPFGSDVGRCLVTIGEQANHSRHVYRGR
jgi:hypothetical protein